MIRDKTPIAIKNGNASIDKDTHMNAEWLYLAEVLAHQDIVTFGSFVCTGNAK